MNDPRSIFQLGSLVEFAGRNEAAEGLYEQGITVAMQQAQQEALAHGLETAVQPSRAKTTKANTLSPVERYTSSFPVGDKQSALGYKLKVDAAYRAAHLPVGGGVGDV